jgi:hypothetical protein
MLFFWIVTPCELVSKYQGFALKMEAICSSEALEGLSTYKSTWRYCSEYQHRHFKNLFLMNYEAREMQAFTALASFQVSKCDP